MKMLNKKNIEELEKKQMKDKVPQFRVGDTVKVFSEIREGDKKRMQGFEGIVINKNGGSNRATFTVRRLVQGVGVERIYPIHSPKIGKIEVKKRGKVRRANLSYLKKRKGSAATRVEERAPAK